MGGSSDRDAPSAAIVHPLRPCLCKGDEHVCADPPKVAVGAVELDQLREALKESANLAKVVTQRDRLLAALRDIEHLLAEEHSVNSWRAYELARHARRNSRGG